MNESLYSQELDIRPNFVKMASTQNQKVWESLSTQEQNLLESQATLRTLDTPEKCDRFFESRVFTKPQATPVAQQFNISRQNQTISEDLSHPVFAAMKKLMS